MKLLHGRLFAMPRAPQFMIGLHGKPRPRRADPGLFKPQGKIRADCRLPAQHARERHARHGEPPRCFSDGEAQLIDHLIAQYFAGMGGIVHGHGSAFSMIVLIIDQFGIRTFKSKRHSPVAIDPHRPVPFQITLERM
jgi:hypothetical protein